MTKDKQQMSPKKLRLYHSDIVLVYQDHDAVEHTIHQIQTLPVTIQSLSYSTSTAEDLLNIQPKIILLCFEQLISSVEFYIHFLEEHKEDIKPHSAVVLTSNKDAEKAYLACRNGLFNNYAVIAPLNEPHRLSLVVLQALDKVNAYTDDELSQLIIDGDEKLASCIENGVSLKNSIMEAIQACQNKLVDETSNQADIEKNSALIKTVIDESFSHLATKFNAHMGELSSQLSEAKSVHKGVADKISLTNDFKINEHNGHIEKEKVLLKKTNILIAEQSDDFINSLKNIFSLQSYNLTFVKDGKDALTEFNKNSYDILLVSYSLPRLNGIDLTHKIREQGSLIPIIAISSQQNSQLIKRWLPLGIGAYLIKPSTDKIILKSVQQELKNPTVILSGQVNSEITWLPEYSVGHELMDTHHKNLFTAINNFIKNDEYNAMLKNFDVIIEYVQIHFKAEEKLLRDIQYKAYEQHVKQHENLVKKVGVLSEKLKMNKAEIHQKVGMFLYRWLSKHILESDMDYKQYLK